MTRRTQIVIAVLLVSCTLAAVAEAQRRWRNRYREGQPPPRAGVPEWENDAEFKEDVFTFVRIKYAYGGGYPWDTDWPDSDLNLSYRLQELTSLKVDPHGKVLELTDPALFDYPFVYLIEPGDLRLNDAEVAALRKYLLQGGFMMVDDFWGEYEWQNFYRELKRVFPHREPRELPLEHEVFHIVYDLKEKPQIPSIHAYYRGRRTERWDADVPHYKGVFDDDGRMMMIVCHNTDLGDGWEREGEDPGYFHQYSEKYAYPLGINIVTYAMTH